MYNVSMSRKKKKALNRSGKLVCPICNQKHILVEHHISGRKIPNANAKSNLVDICDCCHRKIHEGIVIIEGWFMTTSGLELFWHKKDENNFTGGDSDTHIIGQTSK